MTPLKRIRVGFVLDLNERWLGGVNYYRSLLTAIYEDPGRTLDVVLFVNDVFDSAWLEGFPRVEVVRTAVLNPQGRAESLRQYTLRRWGRDVLLSWVLRRHRIDLLSHYELAIGPSKRPKVLSWIPDFQHLHLPDYFSEGERRVRNRKYEQVCQQSRIVILSSESARADLLALYPQMSGRTAVLPFVPQVETGEALPTRADLESRYHIGGRFIHLPNQYMIHKNHALVVEAIGLLAKRGCRITVVSTGHHWDYRHPKYYAQLQDRIAELDIESSYRRLGVVPFADMIALMKESICVVNPSRFEGWSTTVEEAKALGKFILLSDIPVHREQAPRHCAFFGVDDVESLADLMWARWQQAAETCNPMSSTEIAAEHRERRAAFAMRYREIVGQALAG